MDIGARPSAPSPPTSDLGGDHVGDHDGDNANLLSNSNVVGSTLRTKKSALWGTISGLGDVSEANAEHSRRPFNPIRSLAFDQEFSFGTISKNR